MVLLLRPWPGQEDSPQDYIHNPWKLSPSTDGLLRVLRLCTSRMEINDFGLQLAARTMRTLRQSQAGKKKRYPGSCQTPGSMLAPFQGDKSNPALILSHPTGLPIFPLQTSPPSRDTHLSRAKEAMFKTSQEGKTAMGQNPNRLAPSEHPNLR